VRMSARMVLSRARKDSFCHMEFVHVHAARR
jgi:hypothetical protein